MEDFIQTQAALHPSIMPQDALKMCFQAAFGAEHLLTDMGKVEGYFWREYENCQPTDQPLYEMIAPEVCRVNLAAWKKLHLPPTWLFRLFVEAAASVRLSDGETRFFEYINTWSKFACDNGQVLAFSFAELETAVAAYLAACGGKPHAVHHSAQYRAAEKPAYRVVAGAPMRLLPVLTALAGMDGGVIAIDGQAASGKSTLAAALAAVIGAEVVHMDDFFLPKALRTAERMEEAGGNIHYERFLAEVVSPLARHAPASLTHRVFNCQTMDYGAPRTIPPTPWLIVEGSYSHHPHFGGYANLRVFSYTDPKTQIERITARNGERLASMFTTTWIPMEEAYFSAYQIREKSHLTI